jgi:hypothetical protein
MRPIRVTVGSQTASSVIPLDQYISPFNLGLGASLSVGADLTYTVQHTFDDVWSASFSPSTANWFSHATMVNKTTSFDGNYAYPVTAIRLNVTAYTSGSVTLTVVQAGMPNS